MKKPLVAFALMPAFLAAGASVHAAQWKTSVRLQLQSESGVKNPKVYAAAAGGCHTTYKVVGSPWTVRYRRFNNGALSSPTYIPITGWPGGTSDLCEAFNGDIWFTWENWADTQQIWAARSQDGGNNWTTYNVTNYQYGPGQGGEAKNPNIAAFGGPGSATVIAPSWRARTNELVSAVFNGFSWGPIVNTGTFTDNFYATYGVCTSLKDGSVYRIYGKLSGGYWQAFIRRFNGTIWEPEIQASTVTDDKFIARPAIAVSASGRIMCIYERDEQIYSRLYIPEAGWTKQTIATDGSFPAIVALPGRNEFYLVYTRKDGQAYGRRFASGFWEGEDLVSVGQPSLFTVEPDIGADPQGRMYAVWESHPDPGPVAFFSWSDSFAIPDATPPPAPATVTDSGETTDSTSDLKATFSPVTDPESGIDRYEYAIGTTPGGHDVRFWINTNNPGQVNAHNLELQSGVTYYISVRAVNRAGKEGPWRSSDGIKCSPTTNRVFFGPVLTVSASPGPNDSPALARAASGGVHLVFRDASNSLSRIAYRRLDAGGSWGNTSYPSDGTSAGYFPDVAETPTGQVYAIFENPGGRENNGLYFNRMLAAGWQGAAVLAAGTVHNWYPRLATGSGSDYLHCVLHSDGSAYNVKAVVNSAGVWQPAATIGSGAWNSGRYGIPDVATAPNGEALAVWVGGNNLEVRTARRVGGVWQTPVSIASFGAGFIAHPRIAIGPDGLAHVIFTDQNVAPDPAVYYMRQTAGGGWTAPQVVTNGIYPAIAVDGRGNPHIVFGKGAGGNPDIYHKYHNGAAWTLERNLSNNGSVSERPSIEFDTAGSLNVAWQDSGQILFRKSLVDLPGCGAVKKLADNTVVDLYEKVVTAVFASEGALYVQDLDRSSGIRVLSTNTAFAVGDVVNVNGTLKSRIISSLAAERQMEGSTVTKITSGPAPDPLGMNSRTLGGGALPPYQLGVNEGVGVNSIGQLVVYTGTVTYKSGTTLLVDDGGRVPDISGRVGVMVKCPVTPSVNVGDKVRVTGILTGSVPTGWTTNRRHIQLRTSSDIIRL